MNCFKRNVTLIWCQYSFMRAFFLAWTTFYSFFLVPYKSRLTQHTFIPSVKRTVSSKMQCLYHIDLLSSTILIERDAYWIIHDRIWSKISIFNRRQMKGEINWLLHYHAKYISNFHFIVIPSHFVMTLFSQFKRKSIIHLHQHDNIKTLSGQCHRFHMIFSR